VAIRAHSTDRCTDCTPKSAGVTSNFAARSTVGCAQVSAGMLKSTTDYGTQRERPFAV